MVGLEQVERVRDELPGQLPGLLGAVVRADGAHSSVSQFSIEASASMTAHQIPCRRGELAFITHHG